MNEIIIKGAEILDTTTKTQGIGGGIVIIIICFAVALFSGYSLVTKDYKKISSVIATIIIFVLLGLGTIKSCVWVINQDGYRWNEYKITITDKSKFDIDKWEIIKREGKIYTVKEMK